jgi:hypothetical protein
MWQRPERTRCGKGQGKYSVKALREEHEKVTMENVLSYGLSLSTGQTKKKVPFWSRITVTRCVERVVAFDHC